MIWIFSDIYWPAISGVPVTVDFITRTLIAAGFDVGLVSVGDRTVSPPDLACHYAIRSLDNLTFPGDQTAIFSAIRLMRRIPKTEGEVFVIMTPGRLGLAGLAIARFRKRPAVMLHLTDILRYQQYYPRLRPLTAALPKIAFLGVAHLKRQRCGVELARPPRRWQRVRHPALHRAQDHRWAAVLLRLIYDHAQAIVCLSHKSMNELAEMGIDRSRITAIPSGIDIPIRWRQAMEASRLREVAHALPRLLYVGRIVHEKNLILALEAVALLKKDGWKGEFNIVGDGIALKQVRDASESLGIGDLVKFWGEVRREDLWSFYSNARLFVFPSLTETQGLVLSEAAWFGLPSVVVDADSTFLSRREHGVFVSSPTPEALKAVIASVIDDSATLIRTGMVAQAEVQALERAAGYAFIELIHERLHGKQSATKES